MWWFEFPWHEAFAAGVVIAGLVVAGPSQCVVVKVAA